MTTPSRNTQIVAQGLARLASKYVTQPNMRAMLAVYLQPAQDLEDAIWDVIEGRVLATATLYALPETNAVLDELGALVGQPRTGMSDAQYQAMIYLRIAVNRSTGRAVDWSRFAQILLRTSGGPAFYYDDQAGLVLGMWDMTLDPLVVAAALARAVPNGVYGNLSYSLWPDGADYAVGSVYDPSAGQLGLSSVYDTSVGGVAVATVAI